MYRVQNLPLFFLFLMLTGCIAHEKKFVSDVEFKNVDLHTKYYGNIYKGYYGSISLPGNFALNLKRECRKNTSLGGSMFIIFPIPTFEFAIPHPSISKETFSIVLKKTMIYDPKLKATREDNLNPIDFSMIEVYIELGDKIYPMHYTKDARSTGVNNRYVSSLQCSSLNNATLHIKLVSGLSTSFLLNFSEKTEHNFDYINPFDIKHP